MCVLPSLKTMLWQRLFLWHIWLQEIRLFWCRINAFTYRHFVCNLPGCVLRNARLCAVRLGCVEGHPWLPALIMQIESHCSLDIFIDNLLTFPIWKYLYPNYTYLIKYKALIYASLHQAIFDSDKGIMPVMYLTIISTNVDLVWWQI